MALPKEVQDAFYAGARSASVPLCINDSVEIISGDHSGEHAAVISQESVGKDPEFVVELGANGKDLRLPLSSLRLIEGGEP